MNSELSQYKKMKNSIIKAKALLHDAGNDSSGSSDYKKYKKYKNYRYIRISLPTDGVVLKEPSNDDGEETPFNEFLPPLQRKNFINFDLLEEIDHKKIEDEKYMNSVQDNIKLLGAGLTSMFKKDSFEKIDNTDLDIK